MGLDTVELVLEMEDTFNISIPDEDAEKILTVGDCYSYILRKLNNQDSTSCVSLRTFYQLRRNLVELLHIPRNIIHPKTPTNEVIPHLGRRQIWKQLENTLSYRFPTLNRPLWLKIVLVSTFILISMFFLIITHNISGSDWSVLLGYFLMFLWVWFMIYTLFSLTLTHRMAVEFPPNCQTIGDLAKSIQPEPDPLFVGGEYNEKKVWDRLCDIISEQLGVKVEDIKPESSFVVDLGC